MSRYEIGPDVDLDAEEVYEPDGTRLTEDRAEELAAETAERLRGRPSLTATGRTSPAVRARVPTTLHSALHQYAEKHHTSTSEVIRDALEEYLARH
jgi:predicted HicB family RNase H-like nuclease